MPDNVSLFDFLVKVPMCQTQCFLNSHEIVSCNVNLVSFTHKKHTHTCTHTAAHNSTLSVIANVGAPEEEITWTHHTHTNTPVGLCTFNRHLLFYVSLIALFK